MLINWYTRVVTTYYRSTVCFRTLATLGQFFAQCQFDVSLMFIHFRGCAVKKFRMMLQNLARSEYWSSLFRLQPTR